MIPLSVLGLINIQSLSFSLFFFSLSFFSLSLFFFLSLFLLSLFRSDWKKLDFKEISYLVLSWVDNVKHVGNMLIAFADGMQKDIMIKRAQYIENVNWLQQEFHFAVPKTLWKLNMIYNFHFSGCAVWDLSTISFDLFNP